MKVLGIKIQAFNCLSGKFFHPISNTSTLQYLNTFLMKKTYFVSDFYLGSDGRLTSRERERQVVRWLDMVKKDAKELYLVGDVFDYWFEYRKAVPKGFVRMLGKLGELRDSGL